MLAMGFDYDTIFNELSEAEVTLYYKEGVFEETDSVKRMAMATRLGVNADGKQFKKFMDDLDREPVKRKGADLALVEKLKELNKLRGSGARGKRPSPLGKAPRRPPPPTSSP